MAGGTTSTVITVAVETLLFTSLLTASCWFASHYFEVLRMPALIFMFVDTISVMLSVHTTALFVVFSMRRKNAGGAFTDVLLAEISQGFAVVASLMWLCFLFAMFLDLPRITSVPGFAPTASVVALTVVLGFSVIIPLLALIATCASVPEGGSNTLLLNGSTVGAASLIFFVIISFGSGGVMKCSPFDDTASRFIFMVLVFWYWAMLFAIELAIFFKSNPFQAIWQMLGLESESTLHSAEDDDTTVLVMLINGFNDVCSIDYWRIVGGVLNVLILATTLVFSHPGVYATVGIAMCLVVLAHIPLIFNIKPSGCLMWNRWCRTSVSVLSTGIHGVVSDDVQIADVVSKKRDAPRGVVSGGGGGGGGVAASGSSFVMPLFSFHPDAAAGNANNGTHTLSTPRQRRGVNMDV